MNLRIALKHLRLSPFSTGTAEGRAAERYRLALWTVIANAVNRAFGMLVMVLSVRWTLPYLGSERFGVWMTIASFAAMLSFLDLGIGNALTNRVAQASAQGHGTLLRRAVTGGLGVLAILAVALAIVLSFVASAIPWASLIRVDSTDILDEIGRTVVVFAVLFSIGIFANGIARVFHGLQRGFEVHLVGIAGSAFSLSCLAMAVNAEAGLPILLLCSMGGQILGLLALGGLLYLRGHLAIRGGVKAVHAEGKVLLQVGGLFFLLQIGTMVGWGADSILVANISGASAVAVFSVTQRLMQFVSQPLAIINAPLWGAYAEAAAKKDHDFVRRTFLRSIKWTFYVSVAGALLLLLAGQKIVEMWTTGAIVPPWSLLVCMSLWLILESTGNALGVLLNGLGVVRQQVWVVTAFVLLVFPLKLWWGHEWGAFGVVLASIIAYLITTVFGYGIVFRRNVVERMA